MEEWEDAMRTVAYLNCSPILCTVSCAPSASSLSNLNLTYTFNFFVTSITW